MISPSSTLFRYVSRNFITNLFWLLLILLGLIYTFDTIELLRRSSGHDVSFGTILSMAAMRLPYVGQKVVPFAVLFGAIYTCWKMNKTHEMVVIRSAGLSVWQFLSPMFVSALLFGVFATAVINPLSSFMLSKYRQMEVNYLDKDSNIVTVSRTGIWLRQPDEKGYALLHAATFDQSSWHFNDTIVFFFDKKDTFLSRIDSKTARLHNGYWEMKDALINSPEGVKKEPLRRLPTNLTSDKIEESFADPETISFWKIPEFLQIMKDAGFPATRLHIHFQSLLAQPFLLAAMVFLAATFSLRPGRFGGTGAMITLGVLAGFFIFFMESMLQAFGISQKISVYLAAWTPAAVSLLLGTTALLHLEDG